MSSRRNRAPRLLACSFVLVAANASCGDSGGASPGEGGAGGAGSAAGAGGPVGGDAGGTSTSTASSMGGGGSAPGCSASSGAPGETIRNVDIAGTTRRYIVDAPATIVEGDSLALVFVFHGNGGSGEASQGMGLQNVVGAQEQAVFVFPDGLPFMGFGVGWNGACDGYDMEFFDTMIETLSSEYCIDASRIFAAGFSWGGDMCQSLACCRGDVLRAVAPASGPELYPPDQVCPDTARPALRMTYADNDAYPPAMFADRLAWYRAEQGCSETSGPVEPEPCIAWSGCARPVVACEYAGLGHAWPSDWADETWAFFNASR